MPRSGTSVRSATRPDSTIENASVTWPSRVSSVPGSTSRSSAIPASRATASGERPAPNHETERAVTGSGGVESDESVIEDEPHQRQAKRSRRVARSGPASPCSAARAGEGVPCATRALGRSAEGPCRTARPVRDEPRLREAAGASRTGRPCRTGPSTTASRMVSGRWPMATISRSSAVRSSSAPRTSTRSTSPIWWATSASAGSVAVGRSGIGGLDGAGLLAHGTAHERWRVRARSRRRRSPRSGRRAWSGGDVSFRAWQPPSASRSSVRGARGSPAVGPERLAHRTPRDVTRLPRAER